MIAVDSSALLAILLGEPSAGRCAKALGDNRELLISAVTLAEALLVSRGRGVESRLIALFEQLPFEVVPIDAESPWRTNEIHRKWGKGNNPARLNMVDCFSYDVARQHGCPLLFVGNDFSQTDLASAL